MMSKFLSAPTIASALLLASVAFAAAQDQSAFESRHQGKTWPHAALGTDAGNHDLSSQKSKKKSKMKCTPAHKKAGHC